MGDLSTVSPFFHGGQRVPRLNLFGHYLPHDLRQPDNRGPFTPKVPRMYLIPIAWLYVALMMAVAEATSSQGTLLGAFFTLLLYGLLPIGLVLYFIGTPARRRQRLAQEAHASKDAQEAQAAQDALPTPPAPVCEAAPGAPSDQRDSGDLPPGDPLAPVGKKP